MPYKGNTSLTPKRFLKIFSGSFGKGAEPITFNLCFLSNLVGDCATTKAATAPNIFV